MLVKLYNIHSLEFFGKVLELGMWRSNLRDSWVEKCFFNMTQHKTSFMSSCCSCVFFSSCSWAFLHFFSFLNFFLCFFVLYLNNNNMIYFLCLFFCFAFIFCGKLQNKVGTRTPRNVFLYMLIRSLFYSFCLL